MVRGVLKGAGTRAARARAEGAEGRTHGVVLVLDAHGHGGRPCGLSLDGEATGQEEGGGGVPEDGVLTLDAWVGSARTERRRRRRNRARSATAGAEEDGVEGGDPQLSGPIPCT